MFTNGQDMHWVVWQEVIWGFGFPQHSWVVDMKDEIVSCMPIGDNSPYLIAVTKSGKVFSGCQRLNGEWTTIEWKRSTDIPINE